MRNKIIRLTETDLHRIVRNSVNRILSEGFESDSDIQGTDEEFDAFMSWAMTDGNDYGFGDAAGEYVNDGNATRLYMIATQYSRMFKMSPEKAFNMAKEAAEGIYGFLGGMGDNAIDLTNIGTMDVN